MKRKSNSSEGEKQKERHVVTWTQEEDDLLREQITTHGTENWTIIASKFNDKTTRQCRRRWYTYLNSDFKKGGWTPEEDTLLCEAQKVYGNKWTEIAKVVSGRTDNAVKNRFSTLCKKRAKRDVGTKENKTSLENFNAARILSQTASTVDVQTMTAPLMIRRSHLPDSSGNYKMERFPLKGGDISSKQKLRSPLAVLGQNIHDAGNKLTVHRNSTRSGIKSDGSAQDKRSGGTFLKKDDPKIYALMQQAELLSSLARKVHAENTEQSLEDAWKVFQDHLNQNKENQMLGSQISDMDLHLEDFKDLLEDLRSSNETSQPSSWRQRELYDESPLSSEYSTGSTLVCHAAVDLAPYQATGSLPEYLVNITNDGDSTNDTRSPLNHATNKSETSILLNQATNKTADNSQHNVTKENVEVVSALSSIEFSSPARVTPLFRSFAAEIPSPKFSESERNFLIKALGLESGSRPSSNLGSSKISPTCKRALLQSL